ncbi:MAG: hypothetical protein HGB11_08400, partial [Chlorobiales bacterium]|nr:hypothetical protein [Chlorobiales bacterium]
MFQFELNPGHLLQQMLIGGVVQEKNFSYEVVIVAIVRVYCLGPHQGGFIFLLGVFTFPIFFYLLSSLPDRGYPLARLGGMIFTAYIAWLLASTTTLPYSRTLISLIVVGLAVVGSLAFARQKHSILTFLKE